MRVFANMQIVWTFLLSASFLAADCLAQQDAAGKYKGTLECSRCHANPSPIDNLQKVTDFVALDEFSRWIDTDIHARSFLHVIPNETLFDSFAEGFTKLQAASGADSTLRTMLAWSESNRLSQDMCEKLKYDPASLTPENLAGSDFARDCLTCHASYHPESKMLVADVQDYGIGVGCESCHGPSSKWIEPHYDSKWREKNPLEKQELGMLNVRDPVVRAQQCFSCHIGNEKEHKVVTHPMYAAGHPPLPSVEVESFAQQTSRHWRHIEEKPDFKSRDEFAKQNHLTSGDFSEGKAVVLGGIVALRDSINLVAESALNEDREWPEFAAFDCTACHHDLRADGWRQERGYSGRPGRPTLQVWPNTLVRIGLVNIARHREMGEDECQAFLKEFLEVKDGLQHALNEQPFGAAGQLANPEGTGAAQQLVAKLDRLIWEDEEKTMPALGAFGQSDAVENLYMLCGGKPEYFDPETEVLDFNSARQLAWAINVLGDELQRRVKPEEQEFDVEKFAGIMRKLSTNLRLLLPGQSIFVQSDDQQGKELHWRFIKLDKAQAYFENTADRSQLAVKLAELTGEQKAVIQGGYGAITDRQNEMFQATYGFQRRDFLEALAQLKSCFRSTSAQSVLAVPDN